MALQPETRQVMAEVQRELSDLRRRLASVERGTRRPQLAHSSLEEGQSLEVRGPAGETRTRIGWLPDGTVGMVTEGGDPVSAPSAPSVTPSLGGLRVTWDGTLANDVAIPGDFDHMAVHVSTSSGFTPSAATYVGAIRRAGDGGMLPVVPLPYVEHYVVLVPVTTGGIQGDPSAEVAATPVQVDGPDLVAASVDTAHLKAQAVDATKLEAILVLVSRIVAGIPGAARVEMDQGGLRGYDDAGALVFAVDSSGNAVFSGDITASTITGSTVEIGTDAPGFNYGVLEETAAGTVRVRVTSVTGARAQIAGLDEQSEFAVYGSDAVDAPAGGMVALPSGVSLVLYSDGSAATDAPYASMSAAASEASSVWQSPTGSRMRVVARDDYTALFSSPPDSATEPATDADGAVYAWRSPGDVPLMTMQSPVVNTGPGAGMRSIVELYGTTSTRDYARAEVYARRLVVGMDWDQISGVRAAGHGVVFLEPTHSISADRHAPQTTVLQAQPTGPGSAGSWVDFATGEFPPLDFTTGWSGRVKVTIQHTGASKASPGATLSTGFRLSGGWTLAADLSRSAMSRASEPRGGSTNLYSIQQQQVFFLDLPGLTEVTLTPAWRTSSSPVWGTDVMYDLFYTTSITIENLM